MKKGNDTYIRLAHGSGGRLTHQLINGLFRSAFSNPFLNTLDDAAVVNINNKSKIAFTTDSFVITPLFFPGGDIGKLSVCGTVNDLAMKGASPLGLSVSAIIEEGFPISDLRRIVHSMSRAAHEAGVPIVTGDTKVVEKGKADRLFITTSGIGSVAPGTDISGKNARAGDRILINGPIAAHGIAVLTARNDFKLVSKVETDCAPLNHLVKRMLSVTKDIHVLRDPTRGGIATTLNEIAASSNVGIIIDEEDVPISKEVRAACDILGLDPLYIANEGKLLCFVRPTLEASLIKAMKNDTYGKGSLCIGRTVSSPKGVWLKTFSGGLRPLMMLEGEQLPRIC